MIIEPMWIWAILGLILLAAEMATGTIYILWFGIAALSVAIAVWLFPNMPNVIQFLISCVFTRVDGQQNMDCCFRCAD